jgi:predicted ATPase/class 3 adenylate cyclase
MRVLRFLSSPQILRAMSGVGQPTGSVTLVFTDIEGSTRLLEELGQAQYRDALTSHRKSVREAFGRFGGYEVNTQGDSFFYAFAFASDAAGAVQAAMKALEGGSISIRVGVHTGDPGVDGPDYVGLDVHTAARIMGAGHGGQVLVSESTRELLDDSFVLSDLGEHRLKDLTGPRRLYQLGVGVFPPLRTLHRSNLPVSATPFLGREPELAAVVGMVTEPGARLVSLTGPGGTGKTRLALQALAQASGDFEDGVFWVPLAPLRDPDLVLVELASAVGIRENSLTNSVLDALEQGLARKRMLLLLDNAEHLMPTIAFHVGALVAACPSVTVVVTSRERLKLPGEQVFPVPPMTEADGQALFRSRALDAGVDVEKSRDLRSLCVRLDNLPLALELAASRTVLFNPAQLLVRISGRLDLLTGGHNVDARQRTLRETIAWSHDLLDLDEQRLFRQLSVFADGCTYESAEEIASADPDTLQSLLDKSLLRRRETSVDPRYWMLETIREYAAEQLETAGEDDELQRKHLAHFAAVAQTSYEESWSGRQDRTPLIEERENLRVALEFALNDDPETALELAHMLSGYWLSHGGLREGREKLTDALNRASRNPTASRALAVFALGTLASAQRDMAAADDLCLEAIGLFRELDDSRGEGRALLWLGFSAFRRCDLELAMQYTEQGLRVLEVAGDETWRRRGVFNLGLTLTALGDHSRALSIQREALVGVRRDESAFTLAMCLNNLGETERLAGDEAQARSSLEESAALLRQLGAQRFLGASLASLGLVLRRSSPTEAIAALSEALHIARDTDSPDLAAACFEAAAAIYAPERDPWHAARLLGTAATIRARLGADPIEQADADAAEALCRSASHPRSSPVRGMTEQYSTSTPP